MLNYQRVDPLGDVELTSSKKKEHCTSWPCKKKSIWTCWFRGVGSDLAQAKMTREASFDHGNGQGWVVWGIPIPCGKRCEEWFLKLPVKRFTRETYIDPPNTAKKGNFGTFAVFFFEVLGGSRYYIILYRYLWLRPEMIPQTCQIFMRSWSTNSSTMAVGRVGRASWFLLEVLGHWATKNILEKLQVFHNN